MVKAMSLPFWILILCLPVSADSVQDQHTPAWLSNELHAAYIKLCSNIYWTLSSHSWLAGSKVGAYHSCLWSSAISKQNLCYEDNTDATCSICVLSSLSGMYVWYSLVYSAVHLHRYKNCLLMYYQKNSAYICGRGQILEETTEYDRAKIQYFKDYYTTTEWNETCPRHV